MAVEFSNEESSIPLPAPPVSTLPRPSRRQLLALFMVPFVNPFPLATAQTMNDISQIGYIRFFDDDFYERHYYSIGEIRPLIKMPNNDSVTVIGWIKPEPPKKNWYPISAHFPGHHAK